MRRKCSAIGAGFSEHICNDGDVLDVEFTFPESIEHAVIVATKYIVTATLCVQHTGGGER